MGKIYYEPIPKCSVLSPLLWNVRYNLVVDLHFPEDATIVGFVDKLSALVAAKLPKNAEVYATKTVSAVKAWLEKAVLTGR